MTEKVRRLSVWWARVFVESSVNGEFCLTKRKTTRPVLIIDNRAYLVYKFTTVMEHEGYRIRDLKSAGLNEQSLIRTDVLFPVVDSDLIKEAGELSTHDAEMLMEYLKEHPTRRIYTS